MDENITPTTPIAAEESSSKKKAKRAADPKSVEYVVKNKRARRDTNHRKAITIAGIIILILLLLAGGVYAFYSAVRYNNFKVYVETSGSKKLSLSENKLLVPASEVISIIGPEKMTNTTFAEGENKEEYTPIADKLPAIIDHDGSYTNIDDVYIAGTFYMKNVTDQDLIYTERVRIVKATAGTRYALRVMLVRNYDNTGDVINAYADYKTDYNEDIISDNEDSKYSYRLDADGNKIPEEVVPLRDKKIYSEREITYNAEGKPVVSVKEETQGTPWLATPFYNEEYAVHNEGLIIEPGKVVKYSLIVWFEGWDDECVDRILSGEVELTLSFACEE